MKTTTEIHQIAMRTMAVLEAEDITHGEASMVINVMKDMNVYTMLNRKRGL